MVLPVGNFTPHGSLSPGISSNVSFLHCVKKHVCLRFLRPTYFLQTFQLRENISEWIPQRYYQGFADALVYFSCVFSTHWGFAPSWMSIAPCHPAGPFHITVALLLMWQGLKHVLCWVPLCAHTRLISPAMQITMSSIYQQ